jgi:hypothetical protein
VRTRGACVLACTLHCAQISHAARVAGNTWIGGVEVSPPLERSVIPSQQAGLEAIMARLQESLTLRGPLPPAVGPLARQCVANGHQLFFIA